MRCCKEHGHENCTHPSHEIRALRAENERLKRENERLATGRTIEGDGVSERDLLRAEVERLRAVLWQVREAMSATGQAPDGDDDPRRPLASAVWRVTGGEVRR